MQSVKLFILSALLIFACCSSIQTGESASAQQPFSDYWNSGKAEITSYSLKESRDGEMRNGEAVFVFETENISFLKNQKKGNDTKKALKMNCAKNFTAGIQPCALMLSVITTVSENKKNRTLKAAASVQQWSRQSYCEATLKAENYDVKYFNPGENSEETVSLPAGVQPEDELWNFLRINPENLPTGTRQLLPSLLYLQVSGKPVKAYAAQLSFGGFEGAGIYNIEYPELERKLSIFFEPEFPHKILLWEESYTAAAGDKTEKIFVRGAIKKTIRTDYPMNIPNADAALRDSLGLSR